MRASRAVAYAICISLSVVLAACGASNDSDGSGGASSLGEFTPSEGPSASSEAQAATVDPSRVVISTDLAIIVDDFAGVADAIRETARHLGGYVAGTDLYQDDGLNRGAITIRIPSSRHDEALDTIRTTRGVEVKEERQGTKDVSMEYTDLESRLRNLQLTEAQFAQFLMQAKNIDEVIQVSDRLTSTRNEIERTAGRINLYDSQVDYATITTRLSERAPVRAARQESSPIEVFPSAWTTSLEVAEVLVKTAAVLLVVVIWLVPLGIIALIAVQVYQRCVVLLSRLRP
jgi:hypothetical protein